MATLLLLIIVAAVAAWIFYPPFRKAVDGSKTYIVGILTTLGAAIEAIDQNLLAVGLGLDTKSTALLFVGLGIATVLFRAMSKKPGPLAKK